MHQLYLALGSNLGQREQHLRAARAALPPLVQVLRCSSIYETEPWGYLEQPRFLNQVLEAQTELAPEELLSHLKTIERNLGRMPSFQNGPRLIDIDILLYDQVCLDQPGLIIPHPRLHERAFVLIPLVELNPNGIHPRLHRSFRKLCAKVDPTGVALYAPATNDPED